MPSYSHCAAAHAVARQQRQSAMRHATVCSQIGVHRTGTNCQTECVLLLLLPMFAGAGIWKSDGSQDRQMRKAGIWIFRLINPNSRNSIVGSHSLPLPAGSCCY